MDMEENSKKERGAGGKRRGALEEKGEGRRSVPL